MCRFTGEKVQPYTVSSLDFFIFQGFCERERERDDRISQQKRWKSYENSIIKNSEQNSETYTYRSSRYIETFFFFFAGPKRKGRARERRLNRFFFLKKIHTHTHTYIHTYRKRGEER